MIISAANGNNPLIQGWPYISVLQVFTSHGKYPLREDQCRSGSPGDSLLAAHQVIQAYACANIAFATSNT